MAVLILKYSIRSYCIFSNKHPGAFWKEGAWSRGHLLSSSVGNQAYRSPIIQFTYRCIGIHLNVQVEV